MKHVYTMHSGQKLSKAEFIRYFEKKVRKTIRKYNLIGKKEKIIVAVSGGKDSTVVLYLLNKIVKNKNVKIEAYHVNLHLGEYSKKNLKNITNFCKKHKIKLHKEDFRKKFGYSVCYMRDILKKKGIILRSCTICGVLRRYLINKEARKLKATKVVTGHNLDDEAQNFVMNIFRNNVGVLPRLGPKTGLMEHKKFIPRIKPLYFCSEDEVKLYSKLMNFDIVYERCPCSTEAYRRSIRKMLNEFEKKYKGTKNSIISSFLRLLPILKKENVKKNLKFCKKCGEVSMDELCAACKILEKFKKQQLKKLNKKKKKKNNGVDIMTVKVYSTESCPWCKKAKEYLKKKNVEFEDVDVSKSQETVKEMMEKSGQMGVPVLDINGEIIVGFNKEAIDKALEEKE